MVDHPLVTAPPGSREYYTQIAIVARRISRGAPAWRAPVAKAKMPGDPRFWALVDRDGDGCWEWCGALDGHGYGRTWRDGGRFLAHRRAWECVNGPIPEGMFVCHKCDNPPCCNPDHLFVGTALDNMRDAIRKGRHQCLHQAGKKRGPYRKKAPR